jgi:addiction module RelE/StbE family toxin
MHGDCIAEIREYIAHENSQAARRVINSIRQQTQSLIDYPDVGRPGRCEGTRELIINPYPYIVAYRIETDEVQVLAVVHTSRHWPKIF